MKTNLDHALALIFHSEVGYSNRPDDPGGPTQDGVTLRTLSAWRRRPCTIDELRLLGADERNAIFTAQYAAPIRFDDLPDGLDYAVLDASVNSGPSRAAKLLQETLGFAGRDVDGMIGHLTLDAVGKVRDVPHLIYDLSDHRLAFMRTLRNWNTNQNGWKARVEMVEREGEDIFAGRMIDLGARTVLPPEACVKADGPTKLIRIPSGQTAIATVGTVGATAATAVAQASGFLQPYSDVQIIRDVLLGLACVSAAASLIVTLTRAKNGATT